MKLSRVLALTCMFLLSAPVFLAQAAAEGADYDAAHEIIVRGVVAHLQVIDCPKGQKGIKLTLKTDDKIYDVHAGPISWLEKLGFEIKEGQKLEITGAIGPCDGKEVLKARQLTKGNTTVSILSSKGDPLWARTWNG